jgi:hypothetical protein
MDEEGYHFSNEIDATKDNRATRSLELRRQFLALGASVIARPEFARLIERIRAGTSAHRSVPSSAMVRSRSKRSCAACAKGLARAAGLRFPLAVARNRFPCSAPLGAPRKYGGICGTRA